MATKNCLLISPSNDQNEISISFSADGDIMLESTYNEYPIYIQIKLEDWDNVKNFIDIELKKLNENG